MDEVEKIREIPISATPIQGYETEVLRLLIPTSIVDKLQLKSSKKCGLKATLYISPPLTDLKPGDEFKLLYKFPKQDMTQVAEVKEYDINENEGVENVR